mgnify:CR=1 FL=1
MASFNSTLVQLKGFGGMGENEKKGCFNSTLVQLKADNLDLRFSANIVSILP